MIINPGKTYHIYTKCGNCGVNIFIEIPKGVTVNDYLQDKECEKCGCMVIQAGPCL